MLQFSLSTVKAKEHSHHTIFEKVQIDKFSELPKYITAPEPELPLLRWMPAILSNGYRHRDNYVSSQFMCLDYDVGNPTISEMAAKMDKLGLMHIIGTTHHHQKDKNGIICDRFRLVLPMKKPMPESDLQYDWLMERMLTKWGKADEQAVNRTRMFKPCKEIVSMKNGELFDYGGIPTEEQIKEIERKRIERLYPKRFMKSSRLPRGLKERIKTPMFNGQRACSCYEISFSLGQYGYSFEETVSIVSAIPKKYGDGFDHKEMMRNITNGWEGK